MSSDQKLEENKMSQVDKDISTNISQENKIGMLYLCATPIGNLEDITFRVLRVLKEVDLIAAEDTRNSIKLLNHFEIKTPMTSYHEFNKIEKAKVLVDKMQKGTVVALITDAGTPGISDPGEELVRQCHEAGIKVTSLPGPAACITALTMSGRSTRRFAFEAFLPADKGERKEVLSELTNETRTMIIYEAPHRLLKTLKELQEVLEQDRPVTICKELTKRYENAMLTTLKEAVQYYEENEPRGEYVLVIEGKSRSVIKKEQQAQWENMSITDHMDVYLSQGMDKKEAMKAVAKDRGISKRDVYQELL
jgi:16S rRNA (cytidine1402-2'-O)-methyltransferase